MLLSLDEMVFLEERLGARIDSNTGKLAAVGWALCTEAAFLGVKEWTPYLIFVAYAVLLMSLPLHVDRRAPID